MNNFIQIPPWRVGVDVGGTFTDLVIANCQGQTAVFKVASVPSDPGEGVVSALDKASDALGLSISAFMVRGESAHPVVE